MKTFSQEEMEKIIIKIERRLSELRELDINSIQINDPSLRSLETSINLLISDIFGFGTPEYSNYSIKKFYQGSYYTNRDLTINEYRAGVEIGLNEAISDLSSIKNNLTEKLNDLKNKPYNNILKAYEKLDLHPDIAKASNKLYQDGHYANAVEDAVKALNSLVQRKCGISNMDGYKLMQNVFNQNTPKLKFNELKDQSDKDEQNGFMYLFSGAVTGIRNPRAHKIIKDEPERALEFIAFISLLAKLTEDAKL